MIPMAGRLGRAWAALRGRDVPVLSPLLLELREGLAAVEAERDAVWRRALVTAAAEAAAEHRPHIAGFKVCGCSVIVLPPAGGN